MSLFQSLKDFLVEKVGSLTSNLNVEDIQAQVTEQASALKDQVVETAEQATELINVDEAVNKVEEVTGNVSENAQDILSNITEKFKP